VKEVIAEETMDSSGKKLETDPKPDSTVNGDTKQTVPAAQNIQSDSESKQNPASEPQKNQPQPVL
jgi:hypothetical protein